jgi:outer membrane immunogenic protein
MSRVRAIVGGLAGALAMMASAHAADPASAWRVPPVLRGSEQPYGGEPTAPPPRFVPGTPAYPRWGGLYVGGHIGLADSSTDFGQGTESQVAYILRNDVVGSHVANWTTLAKVDGTKQMYGGFVGYNAQWEGDFILGAELNYSRFLSGGLTGSSADSMTRLFNDDSQAPAQHHYFYTATVSSSASARITDYATARARAGFVFDRLLPYAFVGGALGRVDIVRSATVSYSRQDIPDNVTPPTPPITPQATYNFGPQTKSEQQKDAIAYGFTAGAGIDVALTQNVFVRAEYEYIGFLPVHDFKIRIGTGRLGVGIKF